MPQKSFLDSPQPSLMKAERRPTFTQCYGSWESSSRVDQDRALSMETTRKGFYINGRITRTTYSLLAFCHTNEDSFQGERAIGKWRDWRWPGWVWHLMFDGCCLMLRLKDCLNEKTEVRKMPGQVLGQSLQVWGYKSVSRDALQRWCELSQQILVAC